MIFEDLTIRRSTVPAYLRGGSFYLALDESNDEEFAVPGNVLKADLSIANQSHLNHLLSSIRFWGVKLIPYIVFDYLLANPLSTTDEYNAEFPILVVVDAQRGLANNQLRLTDSIGYGSLHLTDYYLLLGCNIVVDDVRLAIEKGHLDIVKRIHVHTDQCVEFGGVFLSMQAGV